MWILLFIAMVISKLKYGDYKLKKKNCQHSIYIASKYYTCGILILGILIRLWINSIIVIIIIYLYFKF